MSGAIEIARYQQMYDFLSAERLPSTECPAVVFGRQDPLVARAAGDLVMADLAEVIVITGGVGKDSGNILRLGYDSEAHYLRHELECDANVDCSYELVGVLLEPKASNGGQNARRSLDVLLANNYQIGTLTAVAHAASARRLAETLKWEAGKRTVLQSDVFVKPTARELNVYNPNERREVLAELLRLADWPDMGLIGPQPELQRADMQDLVEFARSEYGGPTPGQPSEQVSRAIEALPRGVRMFVLRQAVKLTSPPSK